MDWSRVAFTEHVTEAAALIGECHIVLDFPPIERAAYEIKIFESRKGDAGGRYFAVGSNREDPVGFRPVASAATPEEALEGCLASAGIYHRRRVKQATV